MKTSQKRRSIIKSCIATILASSYPAAPAQGGTIIQQNQKHYGFNLINLYDENAIVDFSEWDFKFMTDNGFTYARIPINYRVYTNQEDWQKINSNFFYRHIDKAIELGEKHNIHICLNLHRIPGYCINRRNQEPYDLFSPNPDIRNRALSTASIHWKYIANRYKHVSPASLSFNPINEPPNFISLQSLEIYNSVISELIESASSGAPERPIIIDGLNAGTRYYNPAINNPYIQLSTRGYAPGQLTHYRAPFAPQKEDFSALRWPLKLDDGSVWNEEKLTDHYSEWIKNTSNARILVGEFGVFNTVDHETTLLYIQTLLSIYRQNNWGWALWNLSGPFGIIDSKRRDAHYISVDNRRIDLKFLKTLQASI